jgi:S1-C subfamily serine protease
MRKKIVTCLICITALLSALPSASAASTFSDVRESDWFYSAVELASARGIVSGVGGGAFDPNGALTKAQAIKLASELHASLTGGEIPASDPWYASYLDYAAENGISPPITDYNAPVTRALFAQYIFGAMPGDALAAINDITVGEIVDVPDDSAYGDAVYALYRAGILTGADGYGSFFPDRPITRAQSCAVMLRAFTASYRAKFTLPDALPAAVIYARSVDAMLYLETYDEYGDFIRTGSAFLISPDGTAATNLHVLTGACEVVVKTSDGVTRDFLGVSAYSEFSDLALFRIDGGGYPYLLVSDSSSVVTGDTVYSLGSPLGLEGTFSRGIVSKAERLAAGKFVQFTSYISLGSGGGALLSARGRVVGVTSSAYNGQALNLATPSTYLLELQPAKLIEVSALPAPGGEG